MNTPPIIREERIGGQRLILGDCLQVMPFLQYDAICSDPPYGIAYVHGAEKRKHGSKHNNKPIIGDNQPFDPETFIKGPSILWGANHYAPRLPPSPTWLVWDKRCGRGGGPDQADAEFAWSNLGGPARCINHYWSGFARDSEQGIPREHPTQKPIAVMEWCLGFLPDAKIILDPFMGSGTTLVACQRLGRAGIGIEIDPDYFAIACKRVDEATRQPDLFVTPNPKPIQESLL